jgi:hypothetical protein
VAAADLLKLSGGQFVMNVDTGKIAETEIGTYEELIKVFLCLI